MEHQSRASSDIVQTPTYMIPNRLPSPSSLTQPDTEVKSHVQRRIGISVICFYLLQDLAGKCATVENNRTMTVEAIQNNDIITSPSETHGGFCYILRNVKECQAVDDDLLSVCRQLWRKRLVAQFPVDDVITVDR